jgi:hypothetical protein
MDKLMIVSPFQTVDNQRPIARRIPIDVIPLKTSAVAAPFLQEIEREGHSL